MYNNRGFTHRINDSANDIFFWILSCVSAGFFIALIFSVWLHSYILDFKDILFNAFSKLDGINLTKNKLFLPAYITIFLICIFLIELIFFNSIYWGVIGATILFGFVFYLLSHEFVLKVIGEYQRKRSRKIYFYYIASIIILFIPFSIYLVSQIGQKDFQLSKFLVFAIVPIIFTIINQLSSRIKNDPSTNTLLLNILKKLAISTILFFFFIPLIFMVDQLGGIDPSLQLAITNPFKNSIPWFVGLYFWSATFFFYSGLILFMLSISDIFILLGNIKDSSE